MWQGSAVCGEQSLAWEWLGKKGPLGACGCLCYPKAQGLGTTHQTPHPAGSKPLPNLILNLNKK